MFMAQSSYEPFLSVNPNTSIISPHFCATYPIDVEVARKVFTITDGDFEFTDVNGKFLFKEKGSFLSHNGRVQILDAAGNTTVTLRKKRLTMHKRWKVFRGDSSNSKDCIFNAKLSSLFQLKTKVDVFLAHNTSEKVCDFKVKGSWHERSCTIYAGESSTIVAQMHRNDSDESVLFGKDKFMVTVYPNVDYAFIVALVVILDEMNTTCDSQSSA